MAHKEGHRQVTGWIPTEEAQALIQLARQNERSLAAEMRLAIRAHIEKTPKPRAVEARASA